MRKSDGKDTYVFILGYRYNDLLKIQYSDTRISFKDSLIAMGRSVQIDIINYIKKYVRLTQSDLCRMLNLPYASVARYVDRLLDKRIIIEHSIVTVIQSKDIKDTILLCARSDQVCSTGNSR